MLTLDQLPIGACVEFPSFNDWKGYASAMGFHIDNHRARRPGFCRMRRDVGVVVNVPVPRCFEYEIVN
jgi:hypothetical protein